MGSEDDNLDMPTHERFASLATSQSKARKLKGEGSGASELGQRQSVPLADATAIIENWPSAPKTAPEKLLDHYGADVRLRPPTR